MSDKGDRGYLVGTVSVNYCCVTNHLKTGWPKTMMLVLLVCWFVFAPILQFELGSAGWFSCRSGPWSLIWASAGRGSSRMAPCTWLASGKLSAGEPCFSSTWSPEVCRKNSLRDCGFQEGSLDAQVLFTPLLTSYLLMSH